MCARAGRSGQHTPNATHASTRTATQIASRPLVMGKPRGDRGRFTPDPHAQPSRAPAEQRKRAGTQHARGRTHRSGSKNPRSRNTRFCLVCFRCFRLDDRRSRISRLFRSNLTGNTKKPFRCARRKSTNAFESESVQSPRVNKTLLLRTRARDRRKRCGETLLRKKRFTLDSSSLLVLLARFPYALLPRYIKNKPRFFST